MAQKVNPIAVRLNFNRFSDSSWFSDYYYSTLLYQDLNFRQYLSSVKLPNANKLGLRAAKCVIHHFPKRSLIHLFCLSDPRKQKLDINQQGATVARLWRDCGANDRPDSGGIERSSSQRANYSFPSKEHTPVFEVSPYWLKSSILQKKRALINLHRGIAKSLTEVCDVPVEHQTKKVVAVCKPSELETQGARAQFERGGLQSRPLYASKPMQSRIQVAPSYSDPHLRLRPGWLFRVCPDLLQPICPVWYASNPYASRSLASLHRSKVAPVWLRELEVSLQSRASNNSNSSEIEGPTLEGRSDCLNSSEPYNDTNTDWSDFRTRNRSYFSFYAMHYFFMQKTNSFYILPDRIRICKQTYRYRSKFGSKGAPLGCLNSDGKSIAGNLEMLVDSKLSLTANTLWPTLHDIHERPNRAVWQLLSFARSAPLSRDLLVCKQTSKVTPKITKSLDFYLSNVHFMLSQTLRAFISLHPIKVRSIFQSASLVAQEVACKLEQKKSFRLICRLIFQQLVSLQSRPSCNYIKGIRIACSGRLNGAEIAKTECRKFGETSLHVFSDKIDYAQARASTPYGILGIKVWISYI